MSKKNLICQKTKNTVQSFPLPYRDVNKTSLQSEPVRLEAHSLNTERGLLHYVESLKNRLSALKKNPNNSKFDSIVTIERALNLLPLPDKWPPLSVSSAEKIRTQLISIQKTYLKCINDRKGNIFPDVHNALMAITLFSFHCARIQEPLLTNYSFSFKRYEELLKEDIGYTITNPQVLKKRQEILTYLGKERKPGAELFDPSQPIPKEGEEDSLPDMKLYGEIIQKYNLEPHEILNELQEEKEVPRTLYDLKKRIFERKVPGHATVVQNLWKTVLLSQFELGLGKTCPFFVYGLYSKIWFNNNVTHYLGYRYFNAYHSSYTNIGLQSKPKLSREHVVLLETTYFSKAASLVPTENAILTGALSNDPRITQLARALCEKAVQPMALIQFFLRYKELAEQEDWRCLLEMLLFHPTVYSDGKEEIPLFQFFDELAKEGETSGFWEASRKLIADGLELYYEKRPNQKPDLAHALWFVRLSQKLRTSYQQQTGKEAPILIKEERALIESWLARKDTPESDKAALHFHLLSHYRAKPPASYTGEDWKILCSCWARFKAAHTEVGRTAEDLQLEWELNCWMSELEIDSRHIESAGRGILAAFNLPGVEGWSFSCEGPLCTYTNPNNKAEFWQVNLHTGQIQSQDGTLTLRELSINDPDFQRLFGNETFHVKTTGQTLHFHDKKYGQIKVVHGNFSHGVYRLIDNQWHRFVPHREFEKIFKNDPAFPKILLSDYTHWVPWDPAAPFDPKRTSDYTIRLTDRQTGKDYATFDPAKGFVKGLDSRGEPHVIFDTNLTDYFKEFEDPAFLLAWEESGTGMRSKKWVEFSRYRDQNGAPLSLVVEGDRWCLPSNPNYQLAPMPAGHPLGAFKQSLFLKHKDRESYKLLLPYRGNWSDITAEGYGREAKIGKLDSSLNRYQRNSQLYLEYDWSPDQDISCPNSESTFYLVNLFLLQKEYRLALHYLNKITRSDTLNKTSVDLLMRILHSGLEGKDYSPNACAVRLQAYLLAKRVAPFQKGFEEAFFKGELTPPAHRTLLGVYAIYHKDDDLVDAHLALTNEQERHLIRWIEELELGTVNPNRKAQVEGKSEYTRSVTMGMDMQVAESWNRTTWQQGDVLYAYEISRLSYALDLPPIDYKLDLNKNFVACYEFLRTSTDEIKRRELAYQIQILTSEKVPYWTIQLLHLAYNDPRSAPRLDSANDLDPEIERLEREKDAASARYSATPIPEKRREFDQVTELLNDKNEEKSTWRNRSLADALRVYNSKTSRGSLAGLSPTYSPSQTSRVQQLPPTPFSPLMPAKKEPLQTPQALLERELPKVNPMALSHQFLTAKPQQRPQEAQLQAAKDSLKIKESELTEEERVYLNSIENEVQIYQEDYSSGMEKRAKEEIYTLKEGLSLQALQERVVKTEKETRSFCQKLEKYILLTAKRRPTGAEKLKAHLQESASITREIVLNDLIRASVQPTPEAQRAFFRKLNGSLTNEEIDHLQTLTLCYMEQSIYLKQLERTSDPLKKALALEERGGLPENKKVMHENLCQAAFSSLAATRHYVPQNNPQALLFEYLSGLQVREIQAELIQNTMKTLFEAGKEEKNFSTVFQLMMGEGKTSVILSQLIQLTSERQRVPLFLCHHSQFNSVIGNLKEFQKQRYQKEVIRVDHSREELSSLAVLRHLNSTLKEAKEKGHSLIMKTPMLQMLQLELISVTEEAAKSALFLEEGGANTEYLKLIHRAKELGEILSFIKEECVGLLDEIDLNLNILTSVHFPRGIKHHVVPERIELVKTFYTLLSSDETLRGLVRLEENRQSELTSQDYQEKLLPRLAELVAEKLGFPEEYKKSIAEYLTNQIAIEAEDCALKGTDVPKGVNKDHVDFLKELHRLSKSDNKENQEKANLCALAKYLVQKVLPLTLSKSYNRSYGRDLAGLNNEKTAGKVVPYLGVGTPATTEFGNIYESLCYCLQSALNGGIPGEQVHAFAVKMKEMANHYVQTKKDAFDNTPEAIEFFELTGVHLNTIDQPGKLEEATRAINSSPEKRLSLEAESAATHVTYHDMVLSSDPFALVDQLSQVIGDSGTLWNTQTFSQSVQQNIVRNKGTEGKIIDELLRCAESGVSRVHAVSLDRGIQAALKRILDNHPHKEKVQGLADCGGLLRHWTNEQVANEILACQATNPRIKGILFFHRDTHSGKEGFFIKKKDDPTLYPLNNTQRDEVEKYGLKVEDLFIYYDELRCTGTDIPQNPEAINLLTVDPHRMMIRDKLQGDLRLRGFFTGQHLDVVVDEANCHAFLGGKRGEPPSMLNVIRTLIKNQAVAKGHQTPVAYLSQIRNVARTEALNALVSQARQLTPNNVKEWLAVHERWKKYTLTSFEDQPFEQHGRLERHINSIKFIEEEAKSALAKFKTIPGVTPKQIKKVEASLQTIVEAARKEASLVEKMNSNQGALLGANVELTQELELQVDLAKETEAETRKEIEEELSVWSFPTSTGAYEEKEWTNEAAQAFEQKGTLQADSLQEAIQNGLASRRAKKQFPYEKCFAGIPLKITHNQCHVAAQPLPVFHPLSMSKTADYLLVRKDPSSGEYTYHLVSEKEAGFWMKRLGNSSTRNENVVLLTSDGKEAVPNAHHLSSETRNQASFKKAIWWVNFYNGNLSYLTSKENFKLTKSMLREDSDLKLRYLEMRTYCNKLSRALFQREPLFNPYKAHKTSLGLHGVKSTYRLKMERLEIERLKGLPIEEIDEEDLPFLDVSRVPELAQKRPELLKFLEKSAQIAAVPKEYVDHLSEDAVQFLQPHQIPTISDPKLLRMLNKTQVAHIGSSQLPHIANALLPYITEALIPYVADEKLIFLRPTQTFHITKEQSEKLEQQWESLPESERDEKRAAFAHAQKYIMVYELMKCAEDIEKHHQKAFQSSLGQTLGSWSWDNKNYQAYVTQGKAFQAMIRNNNEEQIDIQNLSDWMKGISELISRGFKQMNLTPSFDITLKKASALAKDLDIFE